jgi:hypothetical protein
MYILKKTPKKAVAKDKDSASTSHNNSGTNNAADDVTITSTTTFTNLDVSTEHGEVWIPSELIQALHYFGCTQTAVDVLDVFVIRTTGL